MRKHTILLIRRLNIRKISRLYKLQFVIPVKLSSVLCLVVSDSLRPHGLQPAGSSVHGDSSGKNTGVGCHALLQGIFPTHGLNPGLLHCRQTLSRPSHQGSPRILEWVAYPFSRGTSWPRNWIRVSCIVGGFFTSWATRELSSGYLFFLEPDSSVQFSSVAQSCPTLCDPMNCSTPGRPVHHQLPEPTQTHVHWVSDAIQTSHPLLSPSSPALNLSQHQGLFKWVSSMHEVAKVLEFQLQHQSFQWTPRTDLL